MTCAHPIGRHKTVRRAWTDEELSCLKLWRVDGGFSFDDIAAKLGRSRSSVKSMANALGIVVYAQECEQREDVWQDCEVEYLREHYYTKPLKEISRALGRTPNAIWNKRRKLGMGKKR